MNKLIPLVVLLTIGVLVVTSKCNHAQNLTEADKANRADLELLSMDKPILFYGRVVDHLNTPVEGIDVIVHVRSSNGIAEFGIKTDSGGRFEVSNIKGNSILIVDIKNRGYEYDKSVDTAETSFENDGSFVAKKDSPVTYTVRKKEPPTLVLNEEFSIVFTKNIPYYEIDLVKLDGREKGYLENYESKNLHIDLRAKAVYSEADSSYTITVEEQDANSGIIALDEMLYVPPASGYQKTFQITVPINTKVKKYLYIKGRAGQIYSRLDTTFKATKEKAVMVVKGWTNPNGERNVDYDGELYGQYLDKKNAETETFSTIKK
ncbi:hypothetical protein [Geotalea uraniireducens]|uniref:Carboxypeptidase regulatory-like domain-containing protein n=1 Tax=Geotalea uraniireducens (strain Rf4) TaxID=351605 RepID=A5G5X5_GEOUR|nr:hypothetical protein [Geotalea uraniireducens]ABQ27193.1 hypothetical protein Gura_3021 [Geotalea uraniireducens Rf4]